MKAKAIQRIPLLEAAPRCLMGNVVRQGLRRPSGIPGKSAGRPLLRMCPSALYLGAPRVRQALAGVPLISPDLVRTQSEVGAPTSQRKGSGSEGRVGRGGRVLALLASAGGSPRAGFDPGERQPGPGWAPDLQASRPSLPAEGAL